MVSLLFAYTLKKMQLARFIMTPRFTAIKLVVESKVVRAGRLTVRQIWTVTLWEGPVEAKSRSSTSLRAENHVSKTPVSKKIT
ncbi:hypothetical protein D8911_13695 [Levilactobacillus brevis]|nr:hypothetical protein D8911_13695 [Levilactobacillus brevis]